jgi:hypothetical protein
LFVCLCSVGYSHKTEGPHHKGDTNVRKRTNDPYLPSLDKGLEQEVRQPQIAIRKTMEAPQRQERASPSSLSSVFADSPPTTCRCHHRIIPDRITAKTGNNARNDEDDDDNNHNSNNGRDEDAHGSSGKHRASATPNRQISYTIVEAETVEDRASAIAIFPPIAGYSRSLAGMDLTGYRCSVLSVDRPSCDGTSPLAAESPPSLRRPPHGGRWSCPWMETTGTAGHVEDDDDEQSIIRRNNSRADYEFLRRIRGHAHDVVQVLQAEKIRRVYLVGVCIGHPYAVEVCRHLMGRRECCSTMDQPPPSSSEEDHHRVEIGGLTLVAPFVSTVCPHSWSVARMGAFVPSSVLYGCTEVMASAISRLIPKLAGPQTIQKMVTPDEMEDGGWTSNDFDAAYRMFLESSQLTKDVTGIEARLGVSKIWQYHVLDKFAVESGRGLVLHDDDDDDDDDDKNAETIGASADSKEGSADRHDRWSNKIPVRIHASRGDKLANLKSIEWITRRCYGGHDCVIEIEERIHSHETMTFFGGPPRDPKLLHRIAQHWNLLSQPPSTGMTAPP